MEALGHNVDLVVVGFPYRLGLWRTGKDGATPVDKGDVRRAKFGFRGLTGVASIVARHELMTGTDAENGDVQFEEGGTVAQLTAEADAGSAAGEDQAIQRPQF